MDAFESMGLEGCERDQVMRAIRCVKDVLAMQRKDDGGNCSDSWHSMQLFISQSGQEVVALLESPFRHAVLDDEDILSVVVRLLVHALNADAVLQVTHAPNDARTDCWERDVSGTPDEPWSGGGQEALQTSDSDCKQDVFFCTLSIREGKRAFSWFSRFGHDGNGEICSLTERPGGRQGTSGGCFADVWKLESWMVPQVAVNYATVLKALGKPVDEKWIKAARDVDGQPPPIYPLLYLKVDDVVSRLKRMPLATL